MSFTSKTELNYRSQENQRKAQKITENRPSQSRKPKQNKPVFKRNNPISLSELELDADFRAKICFQANGKMVGNTARYIPCPQCGDNSVYFSIDLNIGSTMKYPQCNHKNSCGWWGTLKDLL